MNSWKKILVLCIGVVLGTCAASGVASAQYPVYYPAPVVSYPAYPVSVTSTRYGVFGLRRATTVTYAPSVAVSSSFVTPAPVVTSYYAPTYYAPTVVRSYYAAPVYVSPAPIVIYP